MARGAQPYRLPGLAGFILAMGFVLLSMGLSRWVPLARELEERLSCTLGPVSLVQALVLSALSGFAEELLFRITLLALWGPLASSLLFAGLHTGKGRALLLWTAMTGVVGAFFALLVNSGWGLLTVVVAHGGVNAVNLVRLGRMASRRLEREDPQDDHPGPPSSI